VGLDDPFSGYTVVLRIIIYGLVPLFTVLQFVRLRRALHVFQLEGYKRRRFLAWCASNRRRALWLRPSGVKKPLAMTGRAWRILLTATVFGPLLVLASSGVAHIALGGWPADVTTWVITTMAVVYYTPQLLVAADWVLSPVQDAINAGYMRAALRRLGEIDPVVVGVTGSFGKTSTKFAIEALVGPPGSALATPGSFNTPLGVCRTINERLTAEHRYFIVEMGAYGVGEIAELSRFARPTIGVLTSIGPAHLDRFGSLENIRRAKYELVESLPPDGVAVMNVDDPVVRELAESTSHLRVVRYGVEEEGAPDFTAREVATTTEGTALTIVERSSGESLAVRTRLLGRHAIGHLLAGVAVARSLDRPLRELAGAISNLQPVEHRLQIIEGTGRITVIDDAYNSNPDGAAAALEVLESMPARRKVVVTPGMIELGDLQVEYNRALGERAAAVADTLIVVAGVNRWAIVAGAGGGRAEVVTVDSLEQASARLRDLLAPGDVVLFENDLPDQFES
jgi:UDP-N-acetylmuramoyl-tripeptide--D-alanyl-D-alanine ligase